MRERERDRERESEVHIIIISFVLTIIQADKPVREFSRSLYSILFILCEECHLGSYKSTLYIMSTYTLLLQNTLYMKAQKVHLP